jgi:hypothetical protein
MIYFTSKAASKTADGVATLSLTVLAIALVCIGGYFLLGLLVIAALGHLYRRHYEHRDRSR